MKKLFSLVLLIISLMFSNEYSFGSSHLKIVKLVNYPDTAIMGVPYSNIHVWVTNTGSDFFFGDIHVYCKSQSIGIVDTLRDGPLPNYALDANGVDTISLPINPPQFFFRSTLYAAGDNIIVVWPFAISSNFSFETYHTQVYLYDVVGIDEVNRSSISIYPSPVSKTLNIDYMNKNAVERVRIYDLFGREVYGVNEAVDAIDLSGFKEGIYILEMSEKDGNRIIKKILVTAE